MLNGISGQIHESLRLPDDDKLVFIDHHSSALRQHPCPYTNAEPDIVVVTQSHCLRIPKAYIKIEHQHKKYSKVPWHLVHSVGEVKPLRDSKGPSQVAVYAGFLNQARPDKPGVYCISLSPRKYRVLWNDPSGLYSSKDFQWDDIGPLISYVFSLYEPPQDHIKLDTTVTLDTRRDLMLSPRWTVKFGRKVYNDCRVIFVGSPWTRQSWIAVSDTDGCQRIIKDQYQSEGRRYDEGELFDKLQQDLESGAPGCVHVESHGAVEGIRTPIGATRKQKKRLVMTTVGESLYYCKSVFDFLKVMYDALEVHRWILVTKGILHRDISINNILLSNVKLPQSQVPDIHPRPKFIEEILDSKSLRAPSTALLCDFDNGCIYQPRSSTGLKTVKNEDSDDVRRASEELKNRTRSSLGRSPRVDSYHSRRPPPVMPTLEGDAKVAYELVHRDDTLRTYEDPEDLGHGGKMIDRKEFNEICSATGANSLKGRFFHQPMHDAESVFWVIVTFLLRARPINNAEDASDGEESPSPVVEDKKQKKGKERGPPNELTGDRDGKDRDGDGEEEDDGEGDGEQDVGDEDKDVNEEEEEATDHKLDLVWKLLAEHSIQNNSIDSRDSMFQFDVDDWKDALHPKLSFIAPILWQLCEQVQPEYSLVTPAPHELHLHEAIQRILLTLIWNMKASDHILLDQKLRAVTVYRYDVRVRTVEPLSFGSKRPRNDEELATEHGKKKKRH